MAGTKYTNKTLLIAEVADKIKTNINNSTNSQKIQDQLLNLVESLWDREILDGIAYVNKELGDDETAVVGSKLFMFSTILAAADSAATKIIIQKGTYTDTSFLKGTKEFYFEKNALLLVTSSIDTVGFNGHVFGYGSFVSNATSGALFINSGGSMFFEFYIISILNNNVSLIGNGDFNSFTFKGNSYLPFENENKSQINLSYFGVLGYPSSGGSNLNILFKDCFLFASTNSTNLIPLSRPNIIVTLSSCSCSSINNGSIFGRYSSSATSPKVVIKNSVLKSGGAAASEDGIGAISYVYLDNNTLSNKAFHVNTGVLTGALDVDADYLNI